METQTTVLDTQTILNIILSFATVYLAIRNFILSSKKEVQHESQQMTEVRVQLTQVMDLLHDLQKDVRTSTAEFRELSDRVLVIETKLSATIDDISKMKGETNGRSNC